MLSSNFLKIRPLKADISLLDCDYGLLRFVLLPSQRNDCGTLSIPLDMIQTQVFLKTKKIVRIKSPLPLKSVLLVQTSNIPILDHIEYCDFPPLLPRAQGAMEMTKRYQKYLNYLKSNPMSII